MVLASLKGDAEERLAEPIRKAVITVPANFNSLERQATKHAGEIAGLEVLRVINEPTAAALAYGHMNRLSPVVVVFDLGGGTFDISVVLSEGQVYEVLFSLGDNRLGGDDFNIRILSFLLDHLKRQHELDLSNDRESLRLLRRQAILAKHALTTEESTRVFVPEIGVAGGRRVDLDVTLDRDGLREIVKPLLSRLQNYARRVALELSQPTTRTGMGTSSASGWSNATSSSSAARRASWRSSRRSRRNSPAVCTARSIPTRSWHWARRSRPASSSMIRASAGSSW